MGSVLRSSDLTAALRLAGEACEHPRGSRERREHAIRGLAGLVRAQVAVYCDLQRGPPVRLVPELDFGWAGPRERALFHDYCAGLHPALQDPAVPGMFGLPRTVVTVSRADLLGEQAWYRSPHVQELRRPAGIDAFLYSGWFGPGVTRALSFHRPWGDRPFSEREQALVDAFHAGARWLHEAPPPPVQAALLEELPPRLREVLLGLARGLSEKQVADELRLSGHTVHDYVKALHRRLGVASRGELLAVALGAGQRS
jgi:DNA-binding CsgD family transcriptional regulator